MQHRVGIRTALWGELSNAANENTAPSSHIIVWCFWHWNYFSKNINPKFRMRRRSARIELTLMETLSIVVMDIWFETEYLIKPNRWDTTDWSWKIRCTGASGSLNIEHIHRRQFSENLSSSDDKIPEIEVKIILHNCVTNKIIRKNMFAATVVKMA